MSSPIDLTAEDSDVEVTGPPVIDLTKDTCTPRLLCTPEHPRHSHTPLVTDAQSGFPVGQSAHRSFSIFSVDNTALVDVKVALLWSSFSSAIICITSKRVAFFSVQRVVFSSLSLSLSLRKKETPMRTHKQLLLLLPKKNSQKRSSNTAQTMKNPKPLFHVFSFRVSQIGIFRVSLFELRP